MQVFPNPAKNSITISGLQNKGIIKIIAIDGKVVKQIMVTANNMLVDISALNKGIFILLYTVEGKVQKLKIVKE